MPADNEFTSLASLAGVAVAAGMFGAFLISLTKAAEERKRQAELHKAQTEIVALKKELAGRKLRSRRSLAEDEAVPPGGTKAIAPTPQTELELMVIPRLPRGGEKYINTRQPLPYSAYVSDASNQAILRKIDTDTGPKPETEKSHYAFVKAGPRRELHFEPGKIRAAVITCGGLCPGLNNVIQEIVSGLHNLYGCEIIYGIRGGYSGFYDAENVPYALVPHDGEAYLYQDKTNPTVIVEGGERNCQVVSVSSIHHDGGTCIAAGRGGLQKGDDDALKKIVQFVTANKLQHVYVIGGDGSQRGAASIADALIAGSVDCAVIGVPKTIDNDIGIVDRSFGFETAVESAAVAVRAATVEAKYNKPRGIGIVRVMGRHAGFIAANATLAAGEVDLCLVPEVPLVLDGENSCLEHLYNAVETKGHAVVVVAEGAGLDHLQQTGEKDGGGHMRLPPIGEYMKGKIDAHFKGKGKPATIKYIDPSYMIRSIPANAADAHLCIRLAQNAIHGAMAGMTKTLVGVVHNRIVFLPLDYVCDTSPVTMNVWGSTWERVLCATHQPVVRPDTRRDDTQRGGGAPAP